MSETYCSCGKVMYASEKDASHAIKSLARRSKKRQYGKYLCKVSGAWHITTVGKKILNKKIWK